MEDAEKLFSTTAFVGYVIGGFIGSVICIVCDRLWRLYENKVRTDVTIASYSDFDRADLCISIINKGSVALPPSDLFLIIKKDKTSTFLVIKPHTNVKELGWWPHQQKLFVRNLTRKGEIDPELKDFHDKYVLPYTAQLVLLMKESAKTVWKSQEMGESVAAHLRAAYEQGKFPEGLPHKRHLKYETWTELLRRLRNKHSD